MIPFAPPLLVLYGSDTGNAQDVAERIARESSRRHFASRVLPMDAYDVSLLPTERLVVFVASTCGQGDPPPNMTKFWKFLLRRSLPPDSLCDMHTAVFGLGDTGYQHFNYTAKKLAARLSQLGATHIVDKGLGDDQARCGYYAALDPWLQRLWIALRAMHPLPPGTLDPPPDDQGTGQLGPPKLKVTLLQSPQTTCSTAAPNRAAAALQAAEALRRVNNAHCGILTPPVPSSNIYSQGCPFFAPLVTNRRLTAEGHFQDVRHIELDVSEMQQSHRPGDVLAVAMVNSAEAVDAFLTRCELDGSAYIRIEAAAGGGGVAGANKDAPVAEGFVKDFVAGALDVAGGCARRYFFEVAQHFASAEHEKERLEYFASPEGADDLYTYNQKEHRSVLEVLEQFGSVKLPLEWLLELVPALQPRRFSISSSALAHPGQVHLTVAVVDYKTPYKRHKLGLCSSWLAGLKPSASEEHLQSDDNAVSVPVWLEPGTLRMPASLATPLILIGPGTGLAPFRSFLQERRAELTKQQAGDGGAQSVPAPCVLFFGCRNEAGDFLYRDELEDLEACGILRSPGGLQVAFSRDQQQKQYVQHCIQKYSGELWELLNEDGAFIYVAGSANKMPADVATALRKVAQVHGGMSEDESLAWFRKLELSKRYCVEAWS